MQISHIRIIIGFPTLVPPTFQRNPEQPQDHVNAHYCGRSFVHELPAVPLAMTQQDAEQVGKSQMKWWELTCRLSIFLQGLTRSYSWIYGLYIHPFPNLQMTSELSESARCKPFPQLGESSACQIRITKISGPGFFLADLVHLTMKLGVLGGHLLKR
jgi:hypothetical protein